jgi:hypothetical protein
MYILEDGYRSRRATHRPASTYDDRPAEKPMPTSMTIGLTFKIRVYVKEMCKPGFQMETDDCPRPLLWAAMNVSLFWRLTA